jgi:hypothetical protein
MINHKIKGGRMNYLTLIMLCFSILTSTSLVAKVSDELRWEHPDWSSNAVIEKGMDRSNMYDLTEEKLEEVRNKGYIHALHYPVNITGLLIPYNPMRNILKDKDQNKNLTPKEIEKAFGIWTPPFKSMKGMYNWLGLAPYPEASERGIFSVPYPGGGETPPKFHMGATILNTPKGKGLTFSCATCHAHSLFGKSIMGLNNKRPRANEFFFRAKKAAPLVPSAAFKIATGATKAETQQYVRSKKNLKAVGAILPLALGLDTSLPQVALSLSKRSADPYATKSRYYQMFPRKNPLETIRGDSKPMPWWTLKYKTRWLSDGAIVSGNPVLTNFLWNEIGRGTDLVELEKWMKENKTAIMELTAAVYQTKSPYWTDFFPIKSLDLASAKRGEKIFLQDCKKCHGEYLKNWSKKDADQMPLAEVFKTYKTLYHEKTPVKNVGTDPLRYEATKYFAKALNDLAISKWMKTVVVPQVGYVPPPLEGIWARYPYFHNNSIPNLCALFEVPSRRPKTFYQGLSVDPITDFSEDCVGYPTGDDIPESWKKEADAFYDTSRKGMNNSGHSKYLIDKKSKKERYTKQNKQDVIMFLKTL